MPLIKKGDTSPEKSTVFILLHGLEGSRKTSLVATCLNPILCDSDEGRWRAKEMVDDIDVFDFTTWEEFDFFIREKGLFDDHTTIAIDTAKTLLDNFLTKSLVAENANYQEIGGGLSQSGYGALSRTFQEKVLEKAKGKVLLVITHSRVSQVNDRAFYEPNVTGGTNDILRQKADQMGFVTKDGGNVVIKFGSSPEYQSKDTAGLGTIVIPDKSDPTWPTFFQTEVIDKVISALSIKERKRKSHESEIGTYVHEISTFTTLEQLNDINKKLPSLPFDKVVQAIIFDNLLKKAESLGFEYDKVGNTIITKDDLKEHDARIAACTSEIGLNDLLAYFNSQGLSVPSRTKLFNRMKKKAADMGIVYEKESKSFVKTKGETE